MKRRQRRVARDNNNIRSFKFPGHNLNPYTISVCGIDTKRRLRVSTDTSCTLTSLLKVSRESTDTSPCLGRGKKEKRKRKERSTLRATQCANNYTKSARCVWMEFESSFHFSPTYNTVLWKRRTCRNVSIPSMLEEARNSPVKSPVDRQLTLKVIINYYPTTCSLHRVEYLIPE